MKAADEAAILSRAVKDAAYPTKQAALEALKDDLDKTDKHGLYWVASAVAELDERPFLRNVLMPAWFSAFNDWPPTPTGPELVLANRLLDARLEMAGLAKRFAAEIAEGAS